MIFFRTKRSKIINACLDQLLLEIREWIFPPSILYVGNKLRQRCIHQGVYLSLQQACKIVDRRMRR